MKRLCLSRRNKVIAGVCGGIADYFKIDATLVRIILAFFTLMSWGSAIILYIICWAVMPMEAE